MSTADAILAHLHHLIATHGSQSAVARAYKIPAPVLSRVLHGTQAPTPQLLQAIGWEKVVTYQPVSVDESGAE